jgi:hypothetical protein
LFFVPTVFMIVRRGKHSPTNQSSPQLAFGREAEGQTS